MFSLHTGVEKGFSMEFSVPLLSDTFSLHQWIWWFTLSKVRMQLSCALHFILRGQYIILKLKLAGWLIFGLNSLAWSGKDLFYRELLFHTLAVSSCLFHFSLRSCKRSAEIYLKPFWTHLICTLCGASQDPSMVQLKIPSDTSRSTLKHLSRCINVKMC